MKKGNLGKKGDEGEKCLGGQFFVDLWGVFFFFILFSLVLFFRSKGTSGSGFSFGCLFVSSSFLLKGRGG